MSAPKFILPGLLVSCCWKAKKVEVSDAIPLISRSVQSQQGWLNVCGQEEAFQLCRFLISLLTCHQVSRWRLWAVRQRPRGSRLCDLSPEWQRRCQPGGAVTSDSTATWAAAAAAWGKTRCTNILNVLSGLLGMYSLVAVVLWDSGIWNLSQSQFQFG